MCVIGGMGSVIRKIFSIILCLFIQPIPLRAQSERHFYIAPWEWHTNDGASLWHAPGGDAIGMLDLRTLSQMGKSGPIAEGYGLFVYDTARIIPGSFDLGDNLDSRVGAANAAALEIALGLSETPSSTVRDFIWDLFTKYTDPAGISARKPLRGRKNKSVDLFLAGEIVKSESFTQQHFQRTVEVFQIDYERNRTNEQIEAVQKWVGRTMLDLYGEMSDARAKEIVPDQYKNDPVLWRNPETTIGDTFVEATDTNLESHTPTGPNAGTGWAIVEGTSGDLVVNATNDRVQRPVNTGRSAQRMTDALSSANHYAQALCSNFVNGDGNPTRTTGVCTRMSSSAVTYYSGALHRASDTADPYTINKSVTGTWTELATVSPGLGHNATDNTLHLEVDGSALELLAVDGTTDIGLTAIDTAITGNLYAGIVGDHTGANRNAWDNFEAADLAVASVGTWQTRTGRRNQMGRGMGRGR